MFPDWAAFTEEDVQGFALLHTGASRTVGGYTMIQHLIDSLVAEPAVNFTFATGTIWDEGVASAAKNRLRTVLCLRVSERSDPDLVWTRRDPAVWSIDRCLTFTVSQHSTSASNPDDGDALWTLGYFTVAANFVDRATKTSCLPRCKWTTLNQHRGSSPSSFKNRRPQWVTMEARMKGEKGRSIFHASRVGPRGTEPGHCSPCCVQRCSWIVRQLCHHGSGRSDSRRSDCLRLSQRHTDQRRHGPMETSPQ